MHASREQMGRIGGLTKRPEFLKVQQAGRKWVSKSLVLQVAENGLPHARFGLVATKKVNKSAVIRNRIRRRLRAAAFDVLPEAAAPGYDYVLIGRADTVTRAYADLTADLAWCIKRIGCLQTPDAP